MPDSSRMIQNVASIQCDLNNIFFNVLETLVYVNSLKGKVNFSLLFKIATSCKLRGVTKEGILQATAFHAPSFRPFYLKSEVLLEIDMVISQVALFGPESFNFTHGLIV